MLQIALILAAVVIVLLFIAHFFLGLFDRPVFARRETLMESGREGFAIIATSTSPPAIEKYCDLLSVAKKAIDSHEKSEELLSKAAASYGSPDGSSSLGLFISLDEISKRSSDSKDQWGCGFLVQAYNCKEVQKIVEGFTIKNPSYPVKAVRLGCGPVIRGRIPFRSQLSLIIAKYIHWDRAYQACDSYKPMVACEFYVTGKKTKVVHLDYVLIEADSTGIWCCPNQRKDE